jgi:hypothetical protein
MKLLRLFFIGMCLVSIANIRSFSVERKVITHSHKLATHHEHTHKHGHSHKQAKSEQEKPTEQNSAHTHTHDLAVASLAFLFVVPQSTTLQSSDDEILEVSAYKANRPPSPLLDPLFRPPIT